MDAGAERKVPVLGAVEDHSISVGEGARITVGGRVVHQHLVARAHRAAGQRGVVNGPARHGDGGVGTEELFDRRGHQLGLGDEPPGIVGMGGEVPERRADGRPGGVDTGDQREAGHPHDLEIGHRFAVHLRTEQ